MDSGVWCFYTLQGERGESDTHPNAFLVSPTTDGFKIVLEDFVKLFPLAGTAPFHYRFQVPSPVGNVFMDALGPQHRVPVINNTIVAKVLRMDSLKCTASGRTPLPLGSPVPVFRNVSGSTPVQSRHASPAHVTPAKQPSPAQTPASSVKQHSVTPPPRAAPPAAASQPRPVPVAPAPAPPAVKQPSKATATDDDLLFGGGGIGVSPTASPTKARGPISTSPLKKPTRVDEDLVGKSEYVQAAVMARREEEAAKQAARVAEVRAAELQKLEAEAAKDSFKVTLGPKLKDWAEGTGGLKRDVRGLLSTMHTVLWEGAKWEEVPMSKLIDPNRVKFYFRLASRVVHPDQNNTAPERQKFIANYVFHVVENQYRIFEAAELNKA